MSTDRLRSVEEILRLALVNSSGVVAPLVDGIDSEGWQKVWGPAPTLVSATLLDTVTLAQGSERATALIDLTALTGGHVCRPGTMAVGLHISVATSDPDVDVTVKRYLAQASGVAVATSLVGAETTVIENKTATGGYVYKVADDYLCDPYWVLTAKNTEAVESSVTLSLFLMYESREMAS